MSWCKPSGWCTDTPPLHSHHWRFSSFTLSLPHNLPSSCAVPHSEFIKVAGKAASGLADSSKKSLKLAANELQTQFKVCCTLCGVVCVSCVSVW